MLSDRTAQLEEIASQARQMRESQRRYFKTRERLWLIASKEQERALDLALARLGAADGQ